jgi:sugar (pentulose or hexulose) kinase
LHAAGAVLGTLTREWVQRTGLSSQVNIYCGLHDSNASLLAARGLAAMQGRDTTVLSTGTWFVAMRSPQLKKSASMMTLPEMRDCLINVDVEGAPVPSARFMGGREIELLMGVHEFERSLEMPRRPSADPTAESEMALRVLETGAMTLPSAVPGVGPYANARAATLGPVSSHGEAVAKAHLYAAMVADASLDLIGSCDTLYIDGRFSTSPVFVSALAALRPDTTVLVSEEAHGVARGALSLVNAGNAQAAEAQQVAPLPVDMKDYRDRWRSAAEQLA